MSTWEISQSIRQKKALERGFEFRPGPDRIALLYPSPYRVGMSSLGFQWIHKLANDAGLAAERAFLPDDPEAWKKTRLPLCTIETETPLSDFPIIGVSLAYELELDGLLTALELAGIPPLRRDRRPSDPLILLGGPITFSNPLPTAPFVDAILLGEADEIAVPALGEALGSDRESWLDRIEELGGYVPERHGTHLPPVTRSSDKLLPARSHILTPEAELSDMFLLEGERGCHRTCTFCVMRRGSMGGMRLVSPDTLLSLIPENASRVGLVGAAISDHPQLVTLLERLVEEGRGIGISSLRADQVARKPRIAELLRQGGYKTLTVASDAASQRLRRTIAKGTIERHLVDCAELAAQHRYRVLKIYMMVGLPEETEDDIDELVQFTRKLAAIHPIALGIAPFVPKRNTPLDNAGYAGIPKVEKHLKRLRKGLAGKAEVRPTSARWAWIEAELAQGGPEWGEAVYEAHKAGSRFADYKRAFAALDPALRAPWRNDQAAS